MWTSSSSPSSSSIVLSSLLLLIILLYDASCLQATVSAVETSATSGTSATMTTSDDAELHDVNNNGKEYSQGGQHHQHHRQKQKQKQYYSSSEEEQQEQRSRSLLIDRSTYRHNTHNNNNNINNSDNNNNTPLIISEMLHYRTLWQKISSSIHLSHFKKKKHHDDDAQEVQVVDASTEKNNKQFQQISSSNNNKLHGQQQQYNIDDDDVTNDNVIKDIITSDGSSSTTVVNSVGDFNIENARWVRASCPSPSSSSEEEDNDHHEDGDDNDDDDTKAVEVVGGDTNVVCKSKDRVETVSSGAATANNNECRHEVDDVVGSTIDENDDNNNHDDDDPDDDDDVQAGMVLYVADSSFDSTTNDGGVERGSSDSGSEEENAVSTTTTTTTTAAAAVGVGGGSACQTEFLSRHYDDNEDIIQYILLQQESYLGNIDVHKRDFAYNPVVATMSRDDTFKVDNRQHRDGRSNSSKRRQDRSKDSIGSSSKALETRIKEEDESVEAAFRSRHSHSSWSQGEDDHQISFRWWSWFAHLSQLLNTGHYKFHKTFGSTNRDNINRESLSSSSSSYQNNIYEETGKFAFAGGSHGEVWRARRRCPSDTQLDANPRGNSTQSTSCDDGKDLIVKRLKVEQGYLVLEAGLREVYFGELLAREVDSSILFTTYVDHFFRKGRRGQVELWIVFENGGPSLRSYLYEATVAMDGFVMFQHSEFWRRLRMDITASHRHTRRHKTMDDLPNSKNDDDNGNNSSEEVEGRHLLKEVMKQILTSVAYLHERGIIHRDIKPSNILCQTTPSAYDGIIPDRIMDVKCVLADFSSGYDEFSGRNLYGSGPSAAEQTDEYAPPEVLLGQGSSWEPFSSANPYSYDSWSIGVVALELLLGTPNVFSVDQRTTALLTNKMGNASSGEIKKALYLAALSQFCIYVPTNGRMSWPLRKGDPLHDASVAKHSCTLHDFHSALRARDPLGVGFESSADLLLHLIWRLLDMDPLTRISPREALEHPYFTPNNTHDDEDMPPIVALEKLKLFREPLNDFMIPGSHNALEHQTLDPRVDMNSSDIHSDFVCPKCGKKFSDHNSCQQHARSRSHARFCTYDKSTLPPCLHTHSMLPTHATSGYCDIQGRRRTIEDFHTIHLNQNHQFYGIFDGHMGNLASKFAASSFYNEVEERLSTLNDEIKSSDSDIMWKERVALDVEKSFHNLHEGIIEAIDSSPAGIMQEAGTTATILYVTELAIVIANVGDSRAVLSKWSLNQKKEKVVTGLQLTIDHIASSPKERDEVVERGGFIAKSGGIDRVNGSLAVSRSLGDIKLAAYLSQTPHVISFTKEEVHKSCGNDDPSVDNNNLPCFIIVASDGLWDVVDNQDAVDFVNIAIKDGLSLQTAAQLLTQEAYVRGSSDNIGVLIVSL